MPHRLQTKALVFSQTEDAAEKIQSYFRKAGHDLSCRWLIPDDEVANSLDSNKSVEIIFAVGNLEPVLEIHKKNKLKGAIIHVLDTMNSDRIAESISQGAADAVCLDAMSHLLQVALREASVERVRRLAEHQVRKAADLQKRLDSLLDTTAEAVAHIQDGIHTHANPAYAELFGYKNPSELEGLPLMDLVDSRSSDTIKKRIADTQKGRLSHAPTQFLAKPKEGEPIELRMIVSKLGNLEDNDSQSPVLEVLIPHEAPQQAFIPAAAQNSGTSLSQSRQTLYTSLLSVMQHSTGDEKKAVLFVTIDDIKQTEQRYGFKATDEALNGLASWMLEWCQHTDQAFRFSNDEFVLIISRPDADMITAAAQEICHSSGQYRYGDEHHAIALKVSVAAQILNGPEDEQKMLWTLREKSHAMAQSGNKQAHFVTLQSSSTSQKSDSSAYADVIRTALEQNRFKLALQPVTSLEGQNDAYNDVFLRMISRDGQEVPPGKFIPAAEELGLAPMVDQWVIRRIITLLCNPKHSKDISGFFVRLSSSTVSASELLLEWLAQHLKKHPADPSKIYISVQEVDLLNDMAKTHELIDGVRKLGIGVVLSHFGDSDRSGSILEEFQFDFVKLATRFTNTIAVDNESEKAQALLNRLLKQDTKIIAEQVEDASTMARLWQMGVHYIQGSYVHEPEIQMRA